MATGCHDAEFIGREADEAVGGDTGIAFTGAEVREVGDFGAGVGDFVGEFGFFFFDTCVEAGSNAEGVVFFLSVKGKEGVGDDLELTVEIHTRIEGDATVFNFTKHED